MKWSCGWLLLALFIVDAPAQIDPALREDGVLYFEGNLPDKVTATVQTQSILYLHRDFRLALAALYPGQKIEVIGMSHEGYLLKLNYRNNTTIGWIRPADLPAGINPAIFAKAEKEQMRRDAVAVAIANKRVIQGMTPGEVKQAIGLPDQVKSRVDPTGSALTWVYATYRQDPQYQYTLDAFGRPLLQTYYVKVPVGQMTVAFVNGAVVSVSQYTSDPGVVTN